LSAEKKRNIFINDQPSVRKRGGIIGKAKIGSEG
jgi:hypothetical protein